MTLKNKLHFLFIVLCLGFLVGITPVRAAIVDSDQDGLSDSAETEVYHTDPHNPDTDGDGVSDGQEILEGTNPLDPQDSSIRRVEVDELGAQQEILDTSKLAWYIGRASGIAAFILFTISIVNGLLFSTRTMFPSWPMFLSYETYRTLAWTALLLVLLHGLSFTFDPFLHLSLAEALVPGLLSRDFFTTLGFNLTIAVALGIIALYLAILLSVTAEFRAKLAPKWWRKIHYLSFLAYLIFLVHGIVSGTDSKQWWMIWIYSVSATLVIGLTIFRITLAIRAKKTPTPQA